MVVVNLRSDIWIASGKERCHGRHECDENGGRGCIALLDG